MVADMMSGPFSIATDGSNDTKDKQFPLVVSTLCPQEGVKTRVMSVPILTEAATGKLNKIVKR